MLQRVSFSVAGTEIEGILHLPDGETVGGVAVLPGRGGTMEDATFLGDSLAAAGIAAVRFTFRIDGDALAGLADAAGAVRLLRAHPAIPQRVGLLGWSFGGAVAAITAGRDSRIRAAVLIATPAARDYFGTAKPLAEITRTRAKVLLVRPAEDEVVPAGDADRYAAVLTQARVAHRLVTIAAADHNFTQPAQRAEMLRAVTTWLREVLAA
ncbi:MAG TPA: dienelactone hydrolase family protein [Candidatus Limnocylindria bacterium]|nr:dienelactone hydrolase family protein [Candidatus Limnocylindria bacterium]